MHNFLPRVLNLQNPEAGYGYYYVIIEPKNDRPIKIFTYADSDYQAIELAWGNRGFCDLAAPIQVRRKS